MADYTISGNIRDVTPDGTPDGLVGWVSAAQDVVQDSGTNSAHVAPKQLEFDDDGAFEVEVVSGVYTISVQFTGPSLAKEQRQTEPFEVTADVGIGSVPFKQVEVVTVDFAESMYEVRDQVVAVGTTNDTIIAGRINDPASATATALSNSTALQIAPVADLDAEGARAALARGAAYTTNPDDGTSVFQSATGLTVASGQLAASVGGTIGNGFMWTATDLFRLSFRVKITKGTASSESSVGVVVGAPGDYSSTFFFGYGYKAGSGLGFVTAGTWGNLGYDVADSALTDGDLYDITMVIDDRISTASGKEHAVVSVRWAKSDGTGAGFNYAVINAALPFRPFGHVQVRTNVAAGAIDDLAVSSLAVGPAATESVSMHYYSDDDDQTLLVRIPAEPNGLAVLVAHGHGGGSLETGWSSAAYAPLWKELLAAGYTLFFPDMGGNLWGNETAQEHLALVQRHIVEDFKLDPRVLLIGLSMGAGAAMTAIALRTIPVRAARLIDGVMDLAEFWDNPDFASLKAAYGNSASLRDAYNPMALDDDLYDGVPLFFSASAADDVVSKTDNTDAMVTKLGGEGPLVKRITTTGGHLNVSGNLTPRTSAGWLAANL